ncbi:MAG TPA: mannose-6-phosphate isomerase [Clostridiales bacterium]|nr:mannose-6-phosphate isomerase [Clostridiales bacterium]
MKSSCIYPYIFHPAWKDYLWGGRNLEKMGKHLPEGIIAESWEIAAHKDGQSIVDNGPLKGLTLAELLHKLGRDLIGTALPEKDLLTFPLLIKFIDANDRLSVQVHPDDAYGSLFGDYGKNEAWYIVDAAPGSQLVYGLRPGTAREDFEKGLKAGTFESLLHRVDVKPGEVYDIPAGLIHAIGKGIMIVEVQQNSNLTYRVFDYNRTDREGNPRPLHIKDALAVTRFPAAGELPPKASSGILFKLQSEIPEGEAIRTVYVVNRCFALETLQLVRARIHVPGNKRNFMIHTVLSGRMEITWQGTDGMQDLSVPRGQSVLLPAALGPATLSGSFHSLVSYVPDPEFKIQAL